VCLCDVCVWSVCVCVCGVCVCVCVCVCVPTDKAYLVTVTHSLFSNTFLVLYSFNSRLLYDAACYNYFLSCFLCKVDEFYAENRMLSTYTGIKLFSINVTFHSVFN
jgi:hypothetical protein